MSNELVWVEKYRPHKLDECIISKADKKYFRSVLDQGEVQTMLLSGPPGTGKTTVARALCEELECDYLLINASEESGIDVLRTKIKQFASTVSFSGKIKVVILDEADHLNPNSTQPALRGFIEEFSSNCRFILTCNFKNRIIKPLQSRCAIFEFKIPKSEKPQVANAFFKRVCNILDNEKVTYDVKVLQSIITKFFPDFRKTLIELQKYAISGSIDEGALATVGDLNMKELVEAIREKDWKRMRSWVVNNSDNDSAAVFRQIYDTFISITDQVPQLVLLIADYQYKSAFVADQEINMVACLTEIMASVEIK